MDATKPTDQEMAGALPVYIREARAAVNALSAGSGIGVTNLNIAAGSTALTVGTEVGIFGHETLMTTADASVSISTIHGGTNGQIKVFVFRDNKVSIVDGLAEHGHIYLNQIPVLQPFAAQLNDVLALVNIGGDGASVEGFWKELYRQLSLK